LLAFIVLAAVAASLQYFSIDRRRNTEYFINVISNRITEELEEVSSQLDEIDLENVSLDTDFVHPVYIFEGRKLVFWSDYKVVPTHLSIAGDFNAKYLELDQGKYLIIKKLYNGYEIVSLVELFSTPPFTNKYLETKVSDHIFPAAVVALDEAGAEEHDIYLPDGSELFGVTLNIDTSIIGEKVQILIVLLSLLAILMAYQFLHSWTWYFGYEGKVGRGLLLLITGVAFVRWVMIYYGLPYALYPGDLFNPVYYASSSLNPSLGDLLLNILGAVAITTYLGKFVFRTSFYTYLVDASPVIVGVTVVLLNISGFFFLFFHYSLVTCRKLLTQASL